MSKPTKPTKPARPAKPVNLTVAILREIRDELHEVRDEIRTTRVELSERIDATNHRLGAVEGTLVELAQQQRFVVRTLGAGRERETRLERHMEALDARVTALEAKDAESR